MAPEKRKVEYKEIPLNLIDIGPEQSRVRQIEKNIDELMRNIEENDLINPITVFREGERYVLITGQRRFLAVQKLGWKTISAKVIPKPEDPSMAKIISLSENIIREDLGYKDCADAFLALYRKYGTIAAVADETGIPYHIVSKHLKYEALPGNLKELVDDQKIKLGVATRARDVATLSDGTTDPDKAAKLAMYMTKELPKPEQRRALVEVAAEEPTKPAEELVEEAKTRTAVKVPVTLGARWYAALQKAAKETIMDEEDVAATAIMDWLGAKGYA